MRARAPVRFDFGAVACTEIRPEPTPKKARKPKEGSDLPSSPPGSKRGKTAGPASERKRRPVDDAGASPVHMAEAGDNPAAKKPAVRRGYGDF